MLSRNNQADLVDINRYLLAILYYRYLRMSMDIYLYFLFLGVNMGQYKNKTYPLRLNNDLRLKVEYIADKEFRKISQQYELIISKYVEQYEVNHGQLIVSEDGTVTLAKPKEVKSDKSSTSKTR